MLHLVFKQICGALLGSQPLPISSDKYIQGCKSDAYRSQAGGAERRLPGGAVVSWKPRSIAGKVSPVWLICRRATVKGLKPSMGHKNPSLDRIKSVSL